MQINNSDGCNQRRKEITKFNRAFILIALLVGLGCSQIETKRESRSGTDSSAERDDFAEQDKVNSAPPLAVTREEKKVAVILGPGGYKTFAHVGVLKELRKSNIPVDYIVGIEWGALVAGLYAQRGQINEVEWKLYKLEKLDLNNRGFFSSKASPNDMSVLRTYLKENLDYRSAKDAKVNFFCPSLLLSRGAMVWQGQQGSMSDSVSDCLAFPPLLKPERDSVASLFSYSEIITRLKNSGVNIIILVNVLGDGNLFDNPTLKADYATAVLWNEARRAIWESKSKVSEVIDVNTRGVKLSDFESRKLLVTAGEAAGEKAARQIAPKYGF